MKQLLLTLVILTSLLIILPQLALGQELSLKQYLEQVKAKNPGYKGAVENAKGAEARVGEADLITSPMLMLNGLWIDSELQNTQPAFQGTRLKRQEYSLGVGQQTSFGLQAKLSYNLMHQDLEGVSPTIMPVPNYYEGKPVL